MSSTAISRPDADRDEDPPSRGVLQAIAATMQPSDHGRWVAQMNQSSNYDVIAEHPDLDQAVDVDEHGPMFEATLEGLDADDDTAIADG
jgi:hypothetical protein